MYTLKKFAIRLLALCFVVVFAVLFSACAHIKAKDRLPLAGRIWNVQEARFVSLEELVDRVVEAKIVLLGETHDNPVHHELQLLLLQEIVLHSRRPALVMEQFDREFQGAISKTEWGVNTTSESIFEAGHFNRKGWQAEYYEPLVATALKFGLPIIAGNISRNDARVIIRDPSSIILPDVDVEVEEALAEDIRQSHGQSGMTAEAVRGMVKAQRARDLEMAKALLRGADQGGVLIAGIGHVRRDRGVPLYLNQPATVIGFIGVDPLLKTPNDYLDGTFFGKKSFDYVWFTEPVKPANTTKP